MKRLTERDEYGNADIIALSDVMPEIYAGLSFSETNALTEVLNRLAEYEDTGVAPADIQPVKQGTWIFTERKNVYGGKEIKCSECGFTVIVSPVHLENLGEYEAFCCHCGAKMRED